MFIFSPIFGPNTTKTSINTNTISINARIIFKSSSVSIINLETL